MKHLLPFAFIAWLAVALLGCGSSQEAFETSTNGADQERQRIGFETRVDTVKTESDGHQAKGSDTPQERQVQFMVQIGAYKSAGSASRIQEIARDRFRLPITNDFDKALGLYQVRVGFFETREKAVVFREKIQSEYPSEYPDAWIVQLER
jgi:cell division protein FtsN